MLLVGPYSTETTMETSMRSKRSQGKPEAHAYNFFFFLCTFHKLMRVFIPGMKPHSQHISTLSWPAVGIPPWARLPVMVPYRPSPSSCPTDLTTQRAVLWVTRPAPLLLSSRQPTRPISVKNSDDRMEKNNFVIDLLSPLFVSFLVSFTVGMGGGVAAVSCSTSPRYWAPDWTKLLPRQATSWRDATAQNAAADCVKRHNWMKKRKPYWLHIRPLSSVTQLKTVGLTDASLSCFQVSCVQTDFVSIHPGFLFIGLIFQSCFI